jgi:sugar lactone lactonase YvrE
MNLILRLTKAISGLLFTAGVIVFGFSFFIIYAATLSDGMSASNVLGQSSLTGTGSGVTINTFNNAAAVAYDPTDDRLFVVDRTANRVMVFDTASISDGENAVNVLGQSDFVSFGDGSGQGQLDNPSGVAFDDANDRLFVADRDNNRVVVFNVASITDGENAVNVLGQPDFATTGGAASQSKMNDPVGLAYDSVNDRLYVVETTNYRILVYDTASITDGENAINVLGQSNFTGTGSGTTAGTVNQPWGAAIDTTNDRLFVADAANNRTLVYDVASITDGEDAVNVLGQANFTSGTANRGGSAAANTQSFPTGVEYDPTSDRLYVNDAFNNRTLVYDTASITDGEDAGNVLGQSDFTGTTGASTATGQSLPIDVAHDSGNERLFVAGNSSNRVVVYEIDNGGAAPAPTPDGGSLPPTPQCEITANPLTINQGDTTTLKWSTRGQVRGSYYWQLQNSLTVYNNETNHDEFRPEETTTYTMAVVNARGANYCRVTVEVQDRTEDLELEDPDEETEEIIEEDQNEEEATPVLPLTCSAYFNPATIQSGGESSLVQTIEGGVPPYAASLPNNYTTTYTENTAVLIRVKDSVGNTHDCAAGLTIIEDIGGTEGPNGQPLPDPDPITVPSVETISDIATPSVDEMPVTESTATVEVEETQVFEESEYVREESSFTFPELPTRPFEKAAVIAFFIGLAAAIAGAFQGPLAVADMVSVPSRMWNLFLTALGFKKQMRKWGTVYDAKTKQPLDPVYLTLTNTETKEEQTAITDMDGRYSFIVDTPGTYTITANKRDYMFPSALLKDKESDHLYQNLYTGGVIRVEGQGEVITKNIPLDATAENWNEADKLTNTRLKFFKRRDYILAKAADILFYVGFAAAILLTIYNQSIFNIVMVGLYIVLALVKKQGIGGRPHGEVTDSIGNPIPHAILRLISPTLNQEMKHAVADKYGRYHLLANNGSYDLKLEQREGDSLIKEKKIKAEIENGYYNKTLEI